MKILFSASDLIGSKIIRNITEEDVSHCAIYLDNFNLVIQSVFSGFDIKSVEEFRVVNRIVHSVEVVKSKGEEADFLVDVIKKNFGRWYDFGGLVFIGISLLLKKYFNRKMPTQNLWSDSSFDYCIELVVKEFPVIKDDIDFSETLTPGGLYKLLLKYYPNSF